MKWSQWSHILSRSKSPGSIAATLTNSHPSPKKGATLDPTFMNGCEEEIGKAFQCLKCEKKENKFDDEEEDEYAVPLCKSCFIRCHSGHKIKLIDLIRYEDFEDDEVTEDDEDFEKKIVKCECQTSFSKCNFTKC